MTIEEVPIESLSADPANVRRHSEAQIEKLVASLRRFGQPLPLLADQNNVVRVGNARLEAMKRLGWIHCKVVRAELSGVELVAYSVADNRLGDPDVGSTFDTAALADVLAALRAEDAELATVSGFSPDELAALLGSNDVAPTEQAPEEFKAYDDDIPTNCKCPRCGFEWQDSK